MIEWIRLETEYEEFKETCRLEKEYFIPKPIPSIVLWDPLHSRSFRSSQAAINFVLKNYEEFHKEAIKRFNNVEERLGN